MSLAYNDYELIYMIQQKDETALSMLLQSYDYAFHYLATDACGFYSKSIIEDLHVEALECFYQCIDRYRNDQYSFYTFFSQCIRRRLLDKMRMLRHNNYVIELSGLSLDELETSVAGRRYISEHTESYRTEKSIEIECRIACALQAAAEMGEREMQILQYRMNGYSCAEIARIMETTEKNIYYRLKKIQDTANEIYQKTLD